MMRLRRMVGACCAVVALALACFVLCGCSQTEPEQEKETSSTQAVTTDKKPLLSVIVDEPYTIDFQCTSMYYDVPLSVFDRLVENKEGADGEVQVVPSLAESWEVSDDGLTYTFHLRDDVTFSNGNPLTASDVDYTFRRLLTHPDSVNADIISMVKGADALADGKADTLEGFHEISDRDFEITLGEAFEPFLSCLTMAGASILDEESCEAAGDAFGTADGTTIGCGPYVIESWTPGVGMVLAARDDYWGEAPANAGIDMHFVTDPEQEQKMFNDGELDILDLDDIGEAAEFYTHGNIYKDRILAAESISLSYIALNESVEPLSDVRVRHALQLALDRQTMLDVAYSGLGEVQHGLFPRGLHGANPDLPAIPYDVDEAKKLLEEAGYADGFDLTCAVRGGSYQWERSVMETAADMWSKIGVRATVEVMNEDDFLDKRKAGELTCYTARWSADYDDPDNFAYTFFGNRENTKFRSLCYTDDAVMERVAAARAISDPDERIEEYRDLEKKIVQEDCAWVPLFARTHYYVASERMQELLVDWSGWVVPRYREISIEG